MQFVEGSAATRIAWLLATGQPKLEDQPESHVLGRLADRYLRASGS